MFRVEDLLGGRILEATHTLTGGPPLGRLAVYACLLGLQIMSYVNICNV